LICIILAHHTSILMKDSCHYSLLGCPLEQTGHLWVSFFWVGHSNSHAQHHSQSPHIAKLHNSRKSAIQSIWEVSQISNSSTNYLLQYIYIAINLLKILSSASVVFTQAFALVLGCMLKRSPSLGDVLAWRILILGCVKRCRDMFIKHH
jgi:hypothetical protein